MNITSSSLKVAYFLFFNDLAYKLLGNAYRISLLNRKIYAIDPSDKITHITMKITIIPENMDVRKKTLSLKQVTFVFVAKELTALSDIFLTFGGDAPHW